MDNQSAARISSLKLTVEQEPPDDYIMTCNELNTKRATRNYHNDSTSALSAAANEKPFKSMKGLSKGLSKGPSKAPNGIVSQDFVFPEIPAVELNLEERKEPEETAAYETS